MLSHHALLVPALALALVGLDFVRPACSGGPRVVVVPGENIGDTGNPDDLHASLTVDPGLFQFFFNNGSGSIFGDATGIGPVVSLGRFPDGDKASPIDPM